MRGVKNVNVDAGGISCKHPGPTRTEWVQQSLRARNGCIHNGLSLDGSIDQQFFCSRSSCQCSVGKIGESRKEGRLVDEPLLHGSIALKVQCSSSVAIRIDNSCSNRDIVRGGCRIEEEVAGTRVKAE